VIPISYIGKEVIMVIALVIILVAGAIGGLINALMSDNGFAMPKPEMVDGTRIWRTGFLGNMLIGGISAAISWGLYGPLAAAYIFGGPEAPSGSEALVIGLTLSSLVGALLIGVGGARWLSNEVDKKLLRAAASKAASGAPKPELGNRILLAKPSEVLRMVANGE
jgi:hypothetical protein